MSKEGEQVKMLSLDCLIVCDGSIITVKINDDEKVNILKKELKKEKPETIPGEADKLTLYMAKKNGKKDGDFIIDDDEDPDLQKLSNCDVVHNILDAYMNKDTFMKGTWELNEYFKGDLQKKSIHVLVKLPEETLEPSRKKQKLDIPLKVKELYENVAKKLQEEDFNAGNLIHFPEIFGQSFRNGLYIREEYIYLQNIINKELEFGETPTKKILIIGSPGIGKSAFGLVLFLMAMKAKRNVVYHISQADFMYYFTWNGSTYDVSFNPKSNHEYEGYFDGMEYMDYVPEYFKLIYLFASPREDNYNLFKKDLCYDVYMNPWTKQECETFAEKINWSDDDWLPKFNLIGGKPRYLFSKKYELDVLVKKVKKYIPPTLEVLKKEIKNVEGTAFAVEMKHLLYCLYRDVTHPSTYFLMYASLAIEADMENSFNIQSADKLRSLLMTSDQNLQSWRGKTMEAVLLRDLMKCDFIIRPLEGKKNLKEQSYSALNSRSTKIQAASAIKTDDLQLYIPVSKTFPAIDGVFIIPSINYVFYIQCTVSKAHPIKSAHLKHVYNNLTDNNRIGDEENGYNFKSYKHILLFLVTEDIYDDFVFQKYEVATGESERGISHIRQYVGKIINSKS